MASWLEGAAGFFSLSFLVRRCWSACEKVAESLPTVTCGCSFSFMIALPSSDPPNSRITPFLGVGTADSPLCRFFYGSQCSHFSAPVLASFQLLMIRDCLLFAREGFFFGFQSFRRSFKQLGVLAFSVILVLPAVRLSKFVAFAPPICSRTPISDPLWNCIATLFPPFPLFGYLVEGSVWGFEHHLL